MTRRPAALAAFSLLLAACPPPVGTDDTDTDDTGDTDTPQVDDPADLPLLGTWVDGFDGDHDIEAAAWTSGDSTFHIEAVDLDEGVIVAQNDEANAWNPGAWSRFDYAPTAEGDGFWFCQIAFDADSADAAWAAGPADDADPASGGCGGFAWSRLYVPLPIRGAWTDNWGGTHDIREWTWTSGDSLYHVSTYDIDEGWLVAQNDAANAFNPEMWSRFEWTEADGQWWFCQIAFDAATEQGALDAGPADDTDPATSGCGGFAWSSLTPAE